MEFQTKIDLQDIYICSDKIVARKIEDELIIVPIGDSVVDFENALYTLNEIGQDVWGRLSEGTTVNKLCSALVEDYDAPFEAIKEDVLTLLQELLDKNLIVKKR